MLKLGLPSRTCRTSSQPVQLIEKNSKTLSYIPQIIMNPTKRSILSLDEGEMAKTMQRVY